MDAKEMIEQVQAIAEMSTTLGNNNSYQPNTPPVHDGGLNSQLETTQDSIIRGINAQNF
jgi:hypothetical protein